MIAPKIHQKVVKAIASCQTMDQAKVAKRYAELAYKRYKTKHDWPDPEYFILKAHREAESIVCREMGVEFKQHM